MKINLNAAKIAAVLQFARCVTVVKHIFWLRVMKKGILLTKNTSMAIDTFLWRFQILGTVTISGDTDGGVFLVV